MATQYATVADLKQLGLVAGALSGVDEADIDAALVAASSVADGYLASRYGSSLPLTAWPESLTMAVCQIAAFRIMSAIGFNPEDGSHEVIRMGFEDAMRWLRDVSAGRVTLISAPAPALTPKVWSDDSRGF